MSIALACNQKSGETVLEFWKRFNECWSEEAGLAVTEDSDSLMISSFVNNLLPVSATAVKQIQGWTALNKAKFVESLYERDASGNFEIRKAIESHHLAQRANFTERGGGGVRRGGNRYSQQLQRFPQRHNDRDTRGKECFNCGKLGHWARDCRAARRDHHNTSAQNQTQTTPRGDVYEQRPLSQPPSQPHSQPQSYDQRPLPQPPSQPHRYDVDWNSQRR